MLQTIRDKISGGIAVVVLGVIAIVFVFWGLDFKSQVSQYAAKVNGKTIATDTVRRAWQQRQSQLQQMMRNELPAELAKSQQQALLQQFVRQELLSQRAHAHGYRVTDQALAARVKEIPQFQVDGKFSADRYAAMLTQNGLSMAQFERDLQSELLINQLQSGIVDSAFTVPYELERRYALNQQERELDYALIATADFTPSITVTDEQIQKWYETNKSDYMSTETVDLQYIELSRARAEANVNVTEEALKEYYEQVKDRYTSMERRRARHILITASDGLDDAAAKKKAEDLTAQVKAGGDFAALAKANSKDPGSAAKGGDLDWAQRGMFVGPFEDALFSMSPGEIRGPIKTQFGYHVIRLEQVEAGGQRSFADVHDELEAEYRKDRAQNGFYEESQKLGDQAFAALTELDSVAKAMTLPIKQVPGFTREGGGELGNDPSIIEAAFSEDVLEKRQNSVLVPVGEDRALVLRVVAHKPSEPRPLAEVRAQIEARLKVQAAREAATKKGTDALAKLKGGEAWSAVTTQANLKPVGKRSVTRQDSVAPPAVVRTAFKAPKTAITADKPYYEGVATDDGNYAIVAVSAVRTAPANTETPEQKTARQKQAERQLGVEEFAAYIAEAESNADVVKNEKVFE